MQAPSGMWRSPVSVSRKKRDGRRMAMDYKVYILYSESIQRYYCGQTKDLDERLNRHNGGGNKYTKRGRPWRLIKLFSVENRKAAMDLESKIKRRGIRRFLEDI
ncbi:MAG: GIY-YIG nuclease family protein [Flavobacteriaceae bacterium]|nr:GIY-YIG nuclease family protein [Flavobacteriaceae bacterium]